MIKHNDLMFLLPSSPVSKKPMVIKLDTMATHQEIVKWFIFIKSFLLEKYSTSTFPLTVVPMDLCR